MAPSSSRPPVPPTRPPVRHSSYKDTLQLHGKARGVSAFPLDDQQRYDGSFRETPSHKNCNRCGHQDYHIERNQSPRVILQDCYNNCPSAAVVDWNLEIDPYIILLPARCDSKVTNWFNTIKYSSLSNCTARIIEVYAMPPLTVIYNVQYLSGYMVIPSRPIEKRHKSYVPLKRTSPLRAHSAVRQGTPPKEHYNKRAKLLKTTGQMYHKYSSKENNEKFLR